MGYGTGAIMAVPGQDERDWEFAAKFDLPIVRTVQPTAGPPGGRGVHRRRPGDQLGQRRDLAWTAWASPRPRPRSSTGCRTRASASGRSPTSCATGCSPGSATGASRSRSSTTRTALPIALPESMLPVELPDVPDYSPQDVRPGRRAVDPGAAAVAGGGVGRTSSWTWATARSSTAARPTPCRNWAGSCWYELRYLDPANHERVRRPGGRARTGWAGTPRRSSTPRPARSTRAVSTSTSAASSTRCCTCCTPASGTRCCSTWGTCRSEEPFRKLFNQGYIQAYAYTDDRGQYVPAAEVDESGDPAHGDVTWTWQDQPVTPRVRQDGQVAEERRHARTTCTRPTAPTPSGVYEMSMGPLDLSRPWETRAVVGRPAVPAAAVAQRGRRGDRRGAGRRRAGRRRDATGCCTGPSTRVRADYDALRFNTAIARLIELNNALTKLDRVPREVAEPIVLMVAPARAAHRRGAVGAAGPRRAR